MDLRQFKTLYKKFDSGKLDRHAWQTKEYSDYIDGINDDDAIGDWYLKQQIKKSKLKSDDIAVLR